MVELAYTLVVSYMIAERLTAPMLLLMDVNRVPLHSKKMFGIAGSSPAKENGYNYGAVVKLVIMSACHAEVRGFDPRQYRIKGLLV